MFTINGIMWRIVFVGSGSQYLTRSDGSITIGMTNGNNHMIYLDKHLRGRLLDKVTAHELTHAFCFSYDIYMDIEQEEFMADWISNYGRDLIYLLDDLMSQLKRARA